MNTPSRLHISHDHNSDTNQYRDFVRPDTLHTKDVLVQAGHELLKSNDLITRQSVRQLHCNYRVIKQQLRSNMASGDVLLVLTGADRDAQWEQSLTQRLPRELQVRWENLRKPDGSLRNLEDLDRGIFEGVTILFTYAPVPVEWIPKVRFVQLSSAGSDLWASHPKLLDSGVKFATTSGCTA